jgi:Protein of unknown function (DUF3108)
MSRSSDSELLTRGRRSIGAGLALAVLFLAAAASPILAQQKQTVPLPFARGEELVYQGEFSRGLLRGIDVAEFRFKASSEHISRGLDDSAVLHLTGDVVSRGLFPRIAGFKFHQHVESVADTEPFTVLRTTKLDEQGKRVKEFEAVFNHETRIAVWTERQPNSNSTSVDFSEPVQDVLTVIYYLRTRKLDVGESFDVPVSDAGRVFRLSVKAVERKEINSVLGKVKAIRVEPELFGDTALVRARGTLSIWITDDARRVPVKAQLKVDIGTFDIELKRLSYLQPN